MQEFPATDVSTNDSPGGYRQFVLPGGATEQVGHHVRITAPDITGIGAEIWLDGFRLHGVRRYSVTVGTNEASEFTVTFLADSVNRGDE